MNEKLLNVTELADCLNVEKSWVYSRTRETGSGSIPRIQVGKYIRFELSHVMDWLKKQTQE